MTDFNKTNDIEDNLNQDINIFIQQRGTKKSDTIIKGLFFENNKRIQRYCGYFL